jgi:hypothetical protein
MAENDVGPDESDKSDTAIELKKLELERYKAQLDYRKFIFGSVFAAIAIAAIPPLFQLGTAVLEYVKSEQQLRLDQQNKEAEQDMKSEEFREEYIKDFLSDALSQDIELRVRFAEYFSFVSAEKFKPGWENYKIQLQQYRTAIRADIDKLEKELQEKTQSAKADDPSLAELKRHLDWDYNEVGYVAPGRSVTANPRAPEAQAVNVSGSKIIDTTDNLKDRIGCLVANGINYVARYYNSGFKQLTAEESAALSKAGIKMVAIYEAGPVSVSYFSSDRGKRDANDAITYARDKIRQPFGTAIFFSIEYDPSLNDINGPITDYFKAIRDVMSADADPSHHYLVGVYGSGLAINQLRLAKLADVTWLALASGWNGSVQARASGAWDILQTNIATVCGASSDVNNIKPGVNDKLFSFLSPT